jgi:antitoxin ChpS
MSADILHSSPVLHAARDFAKRVSLGWPLRGALLFGSQARGSAHAGSDTDVAVLLGGEPGDFVTTKLALDDVAYDVLLESGIRIQPLPIWECEWAHPEEYSNPRLLQNIAREGLPL